MARELGDVAHYFLPGEPPGAGAGGAHWIAVPLVPRDVARLALLWNLAVELARQGAPAALVAPAGETCTPWPEPGRGPLGVEVVESGSGELTALADAARDASARACTRGHGTPLVLVAVPSAALRKGADAGPLLGRVLLLSRPDERELVETWAALDAIAEQSPGARIGVCVFGVRSLADARRTFEGLAQLAELELERTLTSYGVLIDDVHLSRSIVAQRPIALAQPGSPAARALTDVATMLLADAREHEAAKEPEP
ncbi:MAG: hypothetical protein OZ948_15050 [Deltaproteobacteria bacterium]|nr:hypothetical protein [Deltaproteobacteria bacterium]